ncbi:hypothetical protein GGQ80_003415 [Sphingomonas jinjuensis]|uniref:DUF4169 family protein n=1 Tax=Sphingomonas jinjuensis TaxID=535907 RepID=A0A840FFP8_9SPHN|nr:DUF4169 family protein [Sphingomonas jinjuensis]MBB4155492.1 hypothetical protein [Sphingomonas jinjuensis]
MGDVVNLNRARKAKAKQAATVQAAANRVAYGRTKMGRKAEAAERDRQKNRLDGLLCHEKHGLINIDLD